MYNVQSVQHSVLQWSTGNTHHDIMESMPCVATVSRTAPIHKVCLSNYTGYNLKAQHYRAQPAADYSHADSLLVANTFLHVRRIAGNSVPAIEPYSQWNHQINPTKTEEMSNEHVVQEYHKHNSIVTIVYFHNDNNNYYHYYQNYYWTQCVCLKFINTVHDPIRSMSDHRRKQENIRIIKVFSTVFYTSR